MRMSSRLGALLLVFIVAAAPAVLTACEIVCAVRDSHTPAAGHSCDGTQPSDGPLIGSRVHICGHDEALPTAASQAAPQSLFAVAAVPNLSILSALDDALFRVDVVVATSPGHPTHPVPLRI